MQIYNWRETYKRLLAWVWPCRYLFLIGIVANFAFSAVDASLLWLIKDVTNNVVASTTHLYVRWLPAMVIGFFLLRGVCGFFANYNVERTAQFVVRDVRNSLFDKYTKLPAEHYDKKSAAHLLSVMTYNVLQITNTCTDSLITILRESSLAIGLLAVMLVMSWRLTLVLLVTMPLIFLIMQTMSRRLKRLSHRSQDIVGDVTHVSDEGIQGYREIRLAHAQESMRQRFRNATKGFFQQQMKVTTTSALNSAFVQLILSVPLTLVLYMSTIKSFHISTGVFVSIVVGMISILRPIRRLTRVNEPLQRGFAAAESVFTLLDAKEEPNLGTYTTKRAGGEVVFDSVCFAYSEDTTVLHDISFRVKQGETVAIVGHSGSGKSTLISLLPRFYAPSSGRILLDGVDLQDYELLSLRQQLSMVRQHALLFNDSLANNISFPNNPEPERLARAMEMAYINEFVDHLPEGINTQVGDNGMRLSGGQRQRVAIARALYQQSPILILDEATSSLDQISEACIQSSVAQLMGKQTTFIIAHRLSTIKQADKILVLRQGRLCEHGTHQELLAAAGAYADLYQAQFVEQEQKEVELQDS